MNNSDLYFEIGNLTVYNITKIEIISSQEATKFITLNDITVRLDKDRIYKHYFFELLLKLYSNRKTLNVIYFNDEAMGIDWQTDAFKFLKNKINLPILYGTSLNFEQFKTLCQIDSPEYDDALNNFSLVDHFHKLQEHLASKGLNSLHKKYKNFDEQQNLLLCKYIL